MHPERFSPQQFAFLCELEGESIEKTACICYACDKQIQRNMKNENFMPRWRERKNEVVKRCGIANCKGEASKVTQMTTKDKIEHTLNNKVVLFTTDGAVVHVPLCQMHYNNVYTHIHTPTTCDSCGGKARKGEKINRHCPNPEIVNSALNTVSTDTSSLTKDSIICNACYQHFKVMFRNTLEGRDMVPRMSAQEKDQGIDSILKQLDAVQVSVYTRRESVTMGEYLEYIVCLIGKFVAGKMKNDEAILLPNLYRDFMHELQAHKAYFPQVNACEIDTPSCRWFLSHLHGYFENVLEVQCRHKHYGTLLYHKHCDLIHALSLALGRADARGEKAKFLLPVRMRHNCPP